MDTDPPSPTLLLGFSGGKGGAALQTRPLALAFVAFVVQVNRQDSSSSAPDCWSFQKTAESAANRAILARTREAEAVCDVEMASY